MLLQGRRVALAVGGGIAAYKACEVVRELVRAGVLDGSHIFPDCWVPSDRIVQFLQPLGLEPSTGSNSEKAHAIFEFLAAELHNESPNLHRAFDIPTPPITGTPTTRSLRRRTRCGLILAADGIVCSKLSPGTSCSSMKPIT